MRASRLVFATALFGSLFVAGSSPAAAQLDGGCSASGQWQDTDLFVDAETVGDEVVTIDGARSGPLSTRITLTLGRKLAPPPPPEED